MIDHTRVNPKDMTFLCQHCGVSKPINGGLTSHLVHGHRARIVLSFEVGNLFVKKGDIVVFCGTEAIVEENYGDSGLVLIPGEGRCTWYWKFQDERVMPLEPGKVAGSKRA